LDDKIKFIFALQNLIHQQQNMLKIQLHIEAENWFSSKGLAANSGVYVAQS